MNSIDSLIKWLNSTWKCVKCGKVFHGLFFGYGDIICANCYEKEDQWLFPDNSSLLNRIYFKILDSRLLNPPELPPFPVELEPIVEEAS